MQAVIHRPFYDWDGRKYMEFKIENKIVRVKVPWRYGRVGCRVNGLVTVQEFQAGANVEIELANKVWDGIEYWILSSIKEC
jgi:hypothetical protein